MRQAATEGLSNLMLLFVHHAECLQRKQAASAKHDRLLLDSVKQYTITQAFTFKCLSVTMNRPNMQL